MGKVLQRQAQLRKLLTNKKIATLEELKAELRGSSMTVFRTLSRFGYLSSYSHRGGYYTLLEIPDFDSLGLWRQGEVRFSRHGNLLETAAHFVEHSEAGCTAQELEAVLGVEVKHPLLELKRRGRLARTRLEGRYVYLSGEAGQRRRQELMRKQGEARQEVGAEESLLPPDELKAAIILFYCLLDEKQRRLYAGLEAAKMGHGGDRRVARLLDLAPQTVARGRRELLADAVERGRVRKPGGGRKSIKKKRRK
jgi:hypothetical protein